MEIHSRNHLQILCVVAVTTYILATSSTLAAQGNESSASARPLINNAANVPDIALPAHARAGTGTIGEFDPATLGGRSLRLTLSGGREIDVRLQRVEKDDSAGRLSWVGTIDDMPGSMFVMTRYRDVTTGFLTYGSETWEFRPGAGGKHLFYQVDDDKIPTDEPVELPAELDSSGGSTDDYGTGGVSAAADAGFVQDLLVVYSAAAGQVNGSAILESEIQNAVVAANQAYQNSGINITLNLVGMQEIAYTEPGDLLTSLYDLRDMGDGKLDSVHALRDDLGADIVSLIVSFGGTSCGYGFAMINEGPSFESYAFNVINMTCFSNHSLAHEIGHNQGNMHDRDASTYAGAFPYSYGYRRCASDGTGFRTVMSYNCAGANRITQFSNPYVNYNGYATGIAYESDPVNSAENTRSMNNTADTVAAFRNPAGGSNESAPAAPSSLSANAGSSSNIALSWSDNSGNETGFRLERSANGVDFSEIAMLGADTTGYVDGGLAARSTYYYRVRAYNSIGFSPYSNTQSATTPDPQAPPPSSPYNVTANDNGDGSATVTWVDSSSTATGFEIRRESWNKRKGRWEKSMIAASVPAGVTSIVDQSGAGTFRYSVQAVNSSGGSGFTDPAEITVTGGQKGNGDQGTKSTGKGPGPGKGSG